MEEDDEEEETVKVSYAPPRLYSCLTVGFRPSKSSQRCCLSEVGHEIRHSVPHSNYSLRLIQLTGDSVVLISPQAAS